MTKHLCIYHHNCADGFAAAWAIRKYFAEADTGTLQFHPGTYGDPAPDVTDLYVYIVDFSYKRDELLKMASQAKFIVIIDHHKTSKKDLVDLPENIITCFDDSKSGAMLTWEYCFASRPAPLLFDYIQDRDLWKFDLLGTHEITAAIYAYDFNFEAWDNLIERGVKPLMDEGLAILRKHRKDVTAIVNSATRHMWFGQTKVPVANVPWMYASDVGALLAEGKPFAATYYDDAAGRKWSLRSSKDGADVAEIAESFGGGGHKNAAGFRMTPEETIDFELASGVME